MKSAAIFIVLFRILAKGRAAGRFHSTSLLLVKFTSQHSWLLVKFTTVAWCKDRGCGRADLNAIFRQRGRSLGRECQKPGVLRRELDCLLAETSVQHCGPGLRVKPNAAGLGISADGSVLVVANMYNDLILVIDAATHAIRFEYDLRPYNTTPGADGVADGEYPFTVVVTGNKTAYVSSIHDREIVVVNLAGADTSRLMHYGQVGVSIRATVSLPRFGGAAPTTVQPETTLS